MKSKIKEILSRIGQTILGLACLFVMFGGAFAVVHFIIKYW